MANRRLYNSTIYRRLAKQTGITEDEARRVLLNSLQVITGALAKGDSVTLVGFGTFDTDIRPAGTAFGHPYPEQRVVRFRSGSDLKRI